MIKLEPVHHRTQHAAFDMSKEDSTDYIERRRETQYDVNIYTLGELINRLNTLI
jgi:hypothetical protein